MKRAFLLMTFVLAFVIAMMPVTYAAPQDGTWIATNPDNDDEEIITFEVSNGGTEVKVTYYSTLYDCKKGGDKQWGHFTSSEDAADIDNGDFTWLDGMKKPNKKPVAGVAIAATIEGNFSKKSGTGTLRGWFAAFKGRKFKTQVCKTGTINWEAEWVSSLLSAETDDRRFDAPED
ncbi:MAG: hypothetical protein ABFS56_11535 [Pseudomonadota bacterium]